MRLRYQTIHVRRKGKNNGKCVSSLILKSVNKPALSYAFAHCFLVRKQEAALSYAFCNWMSDSMFQKVVVSGATCMQEGLPLIFRPCGSNSGNSISQ